MSKQQQVVLPIHPADNIGVQSI